MKRKCPKCEKFLAESEFNWRIKDVRRSSYCRICSREYVRKHYMRNRGYYLDKAKRRNVLMRKRVRQYIGSYLRGHPCVDCGENDILVLEFDHRDSGTKDFDINTMIRERLSLNRVKNEISKCDVRCANCHRRRTQKYNGSWKMNMHP